MGARPFDLDRSRFARAEIEEAEIGGSTLGEGKLGGATLGEGKLGGADFGGGDGDNDCGESDSVRSDCDSSCDGVAGIGVVGILGKL